MFINLIFSCIFLRSFVYSITMVFETLTWLRLFLFSTSIAGLLIVSLSVFALRLKPWCSCEICQSFVSTRWSSEFSNLCDWYSNLLQKSETGTIRVHVLGNIITANPENVEYMLKTRFDNYPKGKTFSSILGDLLGRGIFNVDGHLWKFQRKMACLELGSLSAKSYAFETVVSEIRSRLIPLLSSVAAKENGVLDLQDVFQRFSFDSICKFSFGQDPGCLKLSLPVSEFAVAFDLASKLSADRALMVSPLIWKTKRFFNLGTEKKLKEAIKSVNILAEELIKHKRNMDVSSHEDLLSRFMANIDDDKFLRDIIISFVLAGRDTIASALTTFFWLLSNHPDVRLAIREESDCIMGSKTQDLASFEQIREMHYLQAAVHESMRLFPPVQFDSKFCQEDDILPDGTFVAKGTRVTYHPYAMGRMEKIWGPDCLEFKPERWLQDGIFKQVNPFKYPVFQAGLRVCLGKEMALVEMKTVALSLIRQFDIQMAKPNQTLKFMPGLAATVKNGLLVFVQERNR
ncbi:cytochrome P450 94C1-like [Olea europaea var. sylvestris]|uniref:Cytochrome P450 94C1-like n=1 Tax=Olea europaea subsp. europaea TaxID=158383 RepID=A0A8S0QJ96_OLEEU|nr:cytochrome P450 94C1-like [Olea europaea var. sylvestris]CAA2966148.1 cytochrome P450 94C1-like [Olea europaea subsp. europaea]